MAAVLLAVGAENLSVADWIVGTVGGTAAFCIVLLASREVSPSDVRDLAGLVRERARALKSRGASG